MNQKEMRSEKIAVSKEPIQFILLCVLEVRIQPEPKAGSKHHAHCLGHFLNLGYSRDW